jgi:hypothetical protein
MPISMDEYRFPKFVTPQEKKPFSEDSNAKFLDASLKTPMRRYRQDTFPQQGYNPNSNKAIVTPINLDGDDITLPPY